MALKIITFADNFVAVKRVQGCLNTFQDYHLLMKYTFEMCSSKSQGCDHPAPSHPRAACLLIHGFTGTPWAMQELAETLEARQIYTSVPLLPGHGTSPDDLTEVKWEAWFASVEKACHALSEMHIPVFVAGHSVGGALALLVAAKCSVKGVITFSTPYKFADKRLLFLPMIWPFVKAWKKSNSKKMPMEAGYDRYPLKAVWQCRKLLRVMRHCLKRIQCPVLLMHARQDYRIPVGNVYRLRRHLKSGTTQIELLPHPAHTIMRGENGAAVSEIVLEFINRQLAL